LVEDTGPGIPESVDVLHLFETTKPQGSGLGLSIAREIVLAHGGSITFVQRQPHGTVFQVDLPVEIPGV
jgi:signal transduction histidine kinase